MRSTPAHAAAFYLVDRGNDEPEAEGNEDGHPINNVVYKNDIYSEKDEVWKMDQSDYNNFWVSRCHFFLVYKIKSK